MDIKDNWKKELDHERVFFSQWFETEGLTWGEDYRFRMDPNTILQPHVARCLPDKDIVNILDVGAGPLTVLGKITCSKTLNIDACDPMAEVYDEIMAEKGIVPLVRTTYAVAEHLSKFAKADHYDIIYCQNALDHSYNPVMGIREMLQVVIPGGHIILLHEINEAENERYLNLHQWNFCEQDGDFIIWNKAEHHNMNVHLQGQATIEIHSENGYITVWIRKNA